MSRQPPQFSISFDYSQTDWSSYKLYRPAYPRELYDLIYKYHDSHGGEYESALDVGAGIGIVTEELKQKFRHVILSDPSESYVSQAKAHFSTNRSVAGGKNDAASVSFVVRRADDLTPSDLPGGNPQQIDMVAAGTSIHWADLDVCMPRLAELVKPGGTFAAFQYGCNLLFPDSYPKARAAWAKILNKIYETYDMMFEKQVKGTPLANLNSRLDCVPCDPTLWKDVRRIHTCYNDEICGGSLPASDSRVQPAIESFEEYENDALFSRDADFEYIYGYARNIIPAIDLSEHCPKELNDLKEAMGGETIQIKWASACLLATRTPASSLH